jgi:hypothetical protein
VGEGGAGSREGEKEEEEKKLHARELLLLNGCACGAQCVVPAPSGGVWLLTCGVVSSAVCQPDSSRGRTHSARLEMEVGS